MKDLSSILAVGTEVSSGEIVNTNGAWLAEKLELLGFTVATQVIVPDDRPLIERALDFLAAESWLLVVTGGLGPTSDDFTRDVIAHWTGAPLEFSDTAWQELNRLYESRGAQIRPAHRQQCYFPKGAHLLRNLVGTAHGFALDSRGKKFVVLPGPPKEILGMWEASVANYLELFRPLKKFELKTWTCTGVSESAVAEVTEEALMGSGYKIGYRASRPMVKVKVWVPRGDPKAAEWLTRLEQVLKPWLEGGSN